MSAPKITLVTSGHPTTNPRLVKEADALHEAGYNVTVVYCFREKWAFALDEKLFNTRNWKYKMVGSKALNRGVAYAVVKTKQKFSKILFRLASGLSPALKTALAQRAVLFSFDEMLMFLKTHPSDFFIAHNLAALAPVALAARAQGTLYAFDAEDFHRGESADSCGIESQMATLIEAHYLPHAHYVSAASPLIAAEYRKVITGINPVVINNAFQVPEMTRSKPRAQGSGLKLVWFSQHVGMNRGLSDVIRAMGICEDENVTLTIYGIASAAVKAELGLLASTHQVPLGNIKYKGTVQADNLINELTAFDCGLALEPGFSLNNQIALSNKVFSYLAAGIAIILSETPAQLQFIKSHPKVGKSYPIGNVESLANILKALISNRQSLVECKAESLALATKELNWNVEKEKFLALLPV